jgi:single-strand DNA-binding protein
MNKVLLTGRLTRDPEMRVLASGKNVTTFTVATTEFLDPIEKVQYHAVVTWDRLAELAGTYLAHGQRVAIEGRLQTRTWDDDRGQRHWKTEVIAEKLELLDGARVDDFQAAANPQTATTLPSQRDPVPGL